MSRDLQTSGVPPSAKEFCLLWEVDWQFCIGRAMAYLLSVVSRWQFDLSVDGDLTVLKVSEVHDGQHHVDPDVQEGRTATRDEGQKGQKQWCVE